MSGAPPAGTMRRLFDRLAYAVFQTLHPGTPWISPGAVRWLDARLDRTGHGLEFGSGRSTAWLGARLAGLTSVEHDAAWHARVSATLRAAQIDHCQLLHIPLDHPHEEPEREFYDPLPRYVAVLDQFAPASLDLIVVDGHYRTTILRHCGTRLRPGGLLLVDDLGFWPGRQPPVPDGLHLVHESGDSYKATGIWRRPGAG